MKGLLKVIRFLAPFLAVLALVLLLIRPFSVLALKFLWMKDLGLLHMWARPLFYGAALLLTGGLPAAGVMALGMHMAGSSPGPRRIFTILFWVAGGALALSSYQTIILLLAPASGFHDSLTGLDAVFFIAWLPLLRGLTMSLTVTWALSLAAGTIFRQNQQNRLSPARKKTAALVLLGLITTSLFTILLETPLLPLHPRLGIGFTAYFGLLTGLVLWAAAVIFLAALHILRPFKAGTLFKTGILMLVLLPLAGLAWPALLNSLILKPNELMLERPFIRNRLAATRFAWGLHGITPARSPQQDEAASNYTIMRYWDTEPFRQGAMQTLTYRNYYEFADADITAWPDQEGRLAPVVISARELNPARLPPEAQAWDSTHLRYTRGEGLAASFAHNLQQNGLPAPLYSNMESLSAPGAPPLESSRIYFGERSSNWVITRTTADEISPSTGSTNEAPETGIRMGGVLRRLILALALDDRNILLSRYINKNSRLLYHRLIGSRTAAVFRGGHIDADPYPALLSGRLVWVQDVYTLTRRFPLAEVFDTPYGKANCVRGGIRVITDAETGRMRFYQTDPGDFLAQAYTRAFPELFEKEYPPETAALWHYPLTLLQMQKLALMRYHTTNSDTFYNGDDVWENPRQIYGNDPAPMEPYYLVQNNRLTTMAVFVPRGRENLSAVICGTATADGLQLTMDETPGRRNQPGPMQIESLLNQDDALSSLFTLWGQKGSRLIRGNTYLLASTNGYTAFKPLYLVSVDNAMPQLVRVARVENGRVSLINPSAR